MKIPTFLDEMKFDFSTFLFTIIMHNNHAFKLNPHWCATLSFDYGLK